VTPTLFLSLLSVVACGTTNTDDTTATGTPTGSTTGSTSALACTEVTKPSCVDDLIADLGLQDDAVSDGAVTTTTEGEDFVTVVDASAGGYSAASQNPWVYVQFTAKGGVKVEIDDNASLTSLDWDIGLRRYLVRANGGDSGPGCVGAVALREDLYADIAAVPDGMDVENFPTDDFYTDDCSFISDSSGLEGSPNLVLGQWWEYPGCVATSSIPFLLRTNSGDIIKLVIEEYYSSNQDTCNKTGSAGNGSAQIKIRWKKLQ